MPIDNHVVTITKGETDYELRVDNIPFSLLNKSGNKQEEYESHPPGISSSDFQDPVKFSAYPQAYNQYEGLKTTSSKPERAEQPMGYRLDTPDDESPYISPTITKGQFSWSEAQDFEKVNSKTSQVPGIFANQMSKKQVKEPIKKPTLQTPKSAVQVKKSVAQPIITQSAPQVVQAPAIKEEAKPSIDLLDIKESEDALPDLFEDPNPSFIPALSHPNILQNTEIRPTNIEEDYLTKAFNQSAQTHNPPAGDFGYPANFNSGTNTNLAKDTRYYSI
jgi:hypothetical protein